MIDPGLITHLNELMAEFGNQEHPIDSLLTGTLKMLAAADST